jgi:integrase
MGSFDIAEALLKTNAAFKVAKIRVTLEARDGWLYMRATLPPKPHSSISEPHRQRIAVNAVANPAGLKLAEKAAKKLDTLINEKTFTWEDYGVDAATQLPLVSSLGEWVQRFEENYWNTRERNPRSETTWRKDYLAVFSRLDASKALTAEFIQESILHSKPGTRTRKRFCMVLGALARFAGVTVQLDGLQGNYSPKSVTPRDLPSDELIQEYFHRIPNPVWQWMYGMMATFGLRNHECFRVDASQLANCDWVEVSENSKSGASRKVWPCYPEWVEHFKLSEVRLPKANLDQPNEALGHLVTVQFQRYKIPFKPYDLRHCWAVRTMRFGLDITLAAAQMGHTVEVHSRIYHAWINEDVHQRAFNLLMKRGERPMPPPFSVNQD